MCEIRHIKCLLCNFFSSVISHFGNPKLKLKMQACFALMFTNTINVNILLQIHLKLMLVLLFLAPRALSLCLLMGP